MGNEERYRVRVNPNCVRDEKQKKFDKKNSGYLTTCILYYEIKVEKPQHLKLNIKDDQIIRKKNCNA